MKAEIYIHERVKKLYQIHQKAIESINENTRVIEQLAAFAATIFTAWKTRNPICEGQINNWHPTFVGKSIDVIFASPFTLEDARLAIAKDCGFKDWADAEQRGNVPFNLAFEKAVDSLLNGDLATLKAQVKESPNLLEERSKYGHQATLLHYAGSNGVEMWRQKTPYNLPEIVQFLLDAGADKNATMPVYGGDYTTLEMVVTSAHPHAAGLVAQLREILA